MTEPVTKKTAAKKAAPKKQTVAKKNWTVSINERSYRYVDPTYLVPNSDSRDAVIRAVEKFKVDHPTKDIDDIKISQTTGEFHFLPPLEEGDKTPKKPKT